MTASSVMKIHSEIIYHLPWQSFCVWDLFPNGSIYPMSIRVRWYNFERKGSLPDLVGRKTDMFFHP
jgi:hypothetical protein